MMCLVAGGISASAEAASVGPITSLTYSNFTNFFLSMFDPAQVNTNSRPVSILVTGGGPTNGTTSAQVTNIFNALNTASTNGQTTIIYSNSAIFYTTNNPSNFVSSSLLGSAAYSNSIIFYPTNNPSNFISSATVVAATNQIVTDGKNWGNKVGVLQMSPVGGNNYFTDMQGATSQFPGQLGVSSSGGGGSRYTYLWGSTNNDTGTGSNFWQQAISFPGQLVESGNSYWPYSLPGANRGQDHTTFYFLYGSNASTLEAAYPDGSNTFNTVYQPYVRTIAGNPWIGFAGFGAQITDTNSSLVDWDGILLTNANGTKLYRDQYGAQWGRISAAYRVGITNEAGSIQSPLFSQPNLPVYISVNSKRTIDAGSAQIPLGVYWATNIDDSIFSIPFNVANVFDIRQSSWQNAFIVHSGSGNVGVRNTLTVTNNVVIGTPTGGDTSAGLNVNSNASFNTIAGTSSSWTFDGAGTRRFGIVQKNGQYTKLEHGSGSPFIIALSSDTDLQNAPNTASQTTEFIATNGTVIIPVPLGLPSLSPSVLLRLDNNTNVAAVTIGANLSFDGTTLSATGGGGGTGLTNVFDSNFTSIGGTNIHLAGSLNLTNAFIAKLTNTSVAAFPFLLPSSLLRLDSNTNLAVVTIGSGLSFDGTTLTGTGGGGTGLTNTFDPTQFTLVSGTNVHITNGASVTNLAVQGGETITGTLTNTGAANFASAIAGVTSGGYWYSSPGSAGSDNFVAGKTDNTLSSGVDRGVIGGGEQNTIGTGADDNVISGGQANTIGLGGVNGVTHSFISGGYGNIISNRSAAGNGYEGITGGYSNYIGPNAFFSIILGGASNIVTGANSLAAGQRAKTLHAGTFTWADSQASDYSSAANDTFNIRAQGGINLIGPASSSSLTVTNLTNTANFYAANSSLIVSNIVANGGQTNAGALGLTSIDRLKLLRTDNNTNVASVIIGSGISFDGTTISSTATGLTNTFDSNFIILGGTNIHLNTNLVITNFIASLNANATWAPYQFTNSVNTNRVLVTSNAVVHSERGYIGTNIQNGFNATNYTPTDATTRLQNSPAYALYANTISNTTPIGMGFGLVAIASTNNIGLDSRLMLVRQTNSEVNTNWIEMASFYANGNASIAGVLTNSGIQGNVLNTNFISGQVYTNTSGAIQVVSSSAVLGVAAVSGNSVMALESSGNQTNFSAMSTLITSIAMNYTNLLALTVRPNDTYTFTNRSTGAGNTASIFGGQILTPGSYTYTNTVSSGGGSGIGNTTTFTTNGVISGNTNYVIDCRGTTTGTNWVIKSWLVLTTNAYVTLTNLPAYQATNTVDIQIQFKQDSIGQHTVDFNTNQINFPFNQYSPMYSNANYRSHIALQMNLDTATNFSGMQVDGFLK